MEIQHIDTLDEFWGFEVKQRKRVFEKSIEVNLGVDWEGLVTSSWERLEDLGLAEGVGKGIFYFWRMNEEAGDWIGLAAAGLMFNQLTKKARNAIKSNPELMDYSYIDELELSLRQAREGDYVDGVARALSRAAEEHRGLKVFPFVVLPVFANQKYGRQLIRKVSGFVDGYNGYVTQPFFGWSGATLPHTHAINDAWAVSLGETNQHINSTLVLKERGALMPGVVSRAIYKSDQVVFVKAGEIHKIGRLSSGREDLDGGRLVDWDRLFKIIKFDELACLHVYLPNTDWIKRVPEKYRNLFRVNDMVVFEEGKEPWVGDGGAWEKRSCESCGVCYVESDHRESVDRFDVFDKLLDHKSKSAKVFERRSL